MDKLFLVVLLFVTLAAHLTHCTIEQACQGPCCPELNLSSSSYSQAVGLLKWHTALTEVLPETLNSGQALCPVLSRNTQV